ncbi:hypothetical protein BC829DRAFT_404077 [Chytridium lagenaria]|nr:hypothetical protein BC829DRAFT_404077 [Chytridium lagenaria]
MVPSLSAGCPKLELLDLSHTRVTIATLVTAVDLCTSLTSLLLEAALPSFIPVTWNPQHLFTPTDPHLRHAALHWFCALTDDSLLKLSQSCASLRILDASFCPHLTDLSLHFSRHVTSSSLASVSLSGSLAEKCKGLEEVVLHGCASILNSHIRGFATKAV